MLKLSDDDVQTVLTFINKTDTDTLTVSVMGERDTLTKNIYTKTWRL